jgi:hypothetical protein
VFLEYDILKPRRIVANPHLWYCPNSFVALFFIHSQGDP